MPLPQSLIQAAAVPSSYLEYLEFGPVQHWADVVYHHSLTKTAAELSDLGLYECSVDGDVYASTNVSGHTLKHFPKVSKNFFINSFNKILFEN